MKDFQSTINSLLKDHKNRKRYLAFLLALSMIVSVAVPFSLIVPAVSMTTPVAYALDTPPVGASNIANAPSITVEITNVADGTDLTSPDAVGSANNSVDCSFSLNFGFDDLGGITPDQRYLYFEMPAGLKILNEINNEAYKDTNYSFTKIAGYLNISENGLVVFELTDDYIQFLKGKGKLTGFFNFDASVSRAENGDGDQILSFGGTDLTIPFKDKELKLDKKGSLNAGNPDDMRINWTIDITNQEKAWDLNGYTVTDKMLAEGMDVKIEPSSAGNFDTNTKVITLNAEANNTNAIHITYYTKLDKLENQTITNDADLKDASGNVKSHDTEPVEVGKIVKVTKTGKPDYEIAGEGINNKIEWTITIENQYGQSLKDYILEDTRFPADASEIMPSGIVKKNDAGQFVLDTTDKSVTLKYWSVAEPINEWSNSSSTTNKITVKQPGGTPGDEKDSNGVTYYKKSELFNLNKTGTYDKSNHVITWEITVGKLNNNVQSLAGYTLTDTQLANAIDGKITVNPPIKYRVVNGSDLVIEEDTNTDVKFTYQTPVTEELAETANNSQNGGNVKNDVDLKEPDNPTPIKEKEGLTPVSRFENTVSKTPDGSNQTTYYTNGKINADIKWNVNITKEAGLAGKTFTDTLTLPDGVTLKDIKNVELKVSTDRNNMGNGRTFNVTPTISGNGNTFTITFPNDITPQEYYAQLTYVTTVEMPAVEESAYNGNPTITYTVNNVGNFDGTEGSTSTTITRENPNKQENMNISVGKTWDDTNSANRPKEITIRLTREVQTKTYNANGSLVTSEMWKSDTAFETITKTFSESAGWSYTDSLEKTKSVAHDNGTLTQYSYKYKVEEVSYKDADGNVKSISNNRFVVDAEEGYYQVSYNNNELVNNNDNVQITNKLMKNEVINVGVKKQWSNNIPADDMPDSITVQLERYENGSFKEELETQTLTGDSWAYTWNELPKQSVKQNGDSIEVINYSYCVKEVSVTKDGKTYPISNDTFAVTENGSYSVTYGNNSISQTGDINITNTFTPVKTITVGVKKLWQNDDEATRPTAITAQLWQKIGNDGNWKPVEGKTITLGAESTWQWENQNAFADLPAEVVTVKADGTFTKQECYYKVLETAYGETETPITGNSFEYGEGENKGTYKITYSWDNGYNFITPDNMSVKEDKTIQIRNTYEEYQKKVTKSALDKDGNELTVLSPDELSKKLNVITKNGEEYYVITWKLNTLKAKDMRVEDTLPAGFTLYTEDKVEDTSFSFSKYKVFSPIVMWDSNNSLYTAQPCPTYTEYLDPGTKWQDRWYTIEGNNLTFYNGSGNTTTKYFAYCTIIKVSDLEKMMKDSPTDLNIINTCTAGGETDTAIVTIKKGADIPTEQDLLSKTGTGDNQLSCVTYSLDVNPEGKILSNDGEYDITDTFNTVSYNGQTGNALVDATLKSIQVYDADTNDPLNNPLPAGTWGYQIVLNPSTETAVDIKEKVSVSYKSNVFANWTSENWSNVEMTVKFTGTPGEEVNFDVDDGEKVKSVYGEDGFAYYTFSVSEFKSTVQLVVNARILKTDGYTRWEDNFTKCELVSASYKEVDVSAVANLVITVPDGRHLRVDYTYGLSKDGAALQVGDNVTVNNSASLQTRNVSANATADEIAMQIQKAIGGTSAFGNPTIIKVETGKFNIDDLKAKFKFAKYTAANGWQYLTSIGDASPHEIPANGWGAENKAIEIDVNGHYPLKNLESGVLYKLIETESPTDQGYEPISSPNFIADYYFVYNSKEFEYPPDMTSEQLAKVNQITVGGNIRVQNNKLITIEAKKDWYKPPAGDWTVEFELYWSEEKLKTTPETVKRLSQSLSKFGLPNDYPTTQVVTADKIAKWEGLPNGTDDQPIYYYVKEVAYTIDGIRYEWDETTKNFWNADKSKKGEYKPYYVNNAADADRIGDSSIVVTNNKGLVVRKQWLNSDNTEMETAPKGEIRFTLYGKNARGVFEIIGEQDGFTLNNANSWKLRVSENVDLSGYTEFKVVENALDGYGYSISYNAAVTDGIGEIKIINKDNTPSEVSVGVEKEWADGASLHENDSINVKLYRVSRSLTDAEFESLQAGSLQTPLSNGVIEELADKAVTLNKDNEWKHTWSNLDYQNADKQRYFYYVVEEWDGLGTGDGQYTAVYEKTKDTLSNTSYTITNRLPSSFLIQKVWKTDSGALIDNVEDTTIEVELYRQERTSSTDTGNTNAPSNLKVATFGDSITFGYKGGSDASQASYNFPAVMEEKLIDSKKYTSVTVDNKGISSEKINNIQSRLNNYSSSFDIMTIIAGTNDIINDTTDVGSYTDEANANGTMLARMKNLLNTVYSKNASAVVYLGSIPRYTAKWDGNNWNYSRQPATQEACDALITEYNAQLEKLVKAMQGDNKKIYFVDIYAAVGGNVIDGCHPNETGYASIAETFSTAINGYYFPETVNAEIGMDGFPSDMTRLEKVVTSSATERGTYIISAQNNWLLDIDDLTDDGDYVYYVKEVTNSGSGASSGWTVTYQNNGQLAENDETIIITNTKVIVPIDITVEKKWNDHNSASRPTDLTLTLQQKAGAEGTWENFAWDDRTLTKDDANSKWTYSYTGLPSENGNGEKFYYRIEETVPDGYAQTAASNNDGISIDSTDKTILLTNTKTVSLGLKKDWVGGENESIKVKIYRSTNSADVPEQPQIMTLTAEKTRLSPGDTTQLTVNRSESVTYTSSDTSVATVENGVVTAVGEGTATITATCGAETATVEITVATKPHLELTIDKQTIEIGQTANLTAAMSDGSTPNVTYSVTQEGIVSISGNTVTGTGAGKATITATDADNNTASVELGVVYPQFTVSDMQIGVGKSQKITTSDNYGGYVYAIGSDANGIISSIDQEGNVRINESAQIGNTATITVSREGNEAKTLTVTVVAAESPKVMNSADATYFDIELPAEYQAKNVSQVRITYGSSPTGAWYVDSIDSSNNATYLGWINSNGNLYLPTGTTYNNYVMTASMDGKQVHHLRFRKDNSGNEFNMTVTKLEINFTDGTAYTCTSFTNSTTDPVEPTDPDPTEPTDPDPTEPTSPDPTEPTSPDPTDPTPEGEYTWIETDGKDLSKYKGYIEKIKIKCSGATTGCTGWLQVSDQYLGTSSFDLVGNDFIADVSSMKDSITQCIFTLYNAWNGSMSISVVGYEIYVPTSCVSAPTRSLPHRMTLMQTTRATAASGGELVEIGGKTELSISKAQHPDWTYTIAALPAYDDSGAAYYYWVVEENVTGYETSYSFTDADGNTVHCINAAQLTNNKGDITIRNTKSDTSGVVMPSTGGTGTAGYTKAGGAIVIASTAVYILIKRRRRKAS